MNSDTVKIGSIILTTTEFLRLSRDQIAQIYLTEAARIGIIPDDEIHFARGGGKIIDDHETRALTMNPIVWRK